MEIKQMRHWVLTERDVAILKYTLEHDGQPLRTISEATGFKINHITSALVKFKSMGLRKNHHVAA